MERTIRSRRNRRIIALGLAAAVALVAAACTPSPLAPTIVSVTAGSFHTCVVRADGSAQCWGDNQGGQLGDDTNDNSTAPVTVARLAGTASIGAGAFHTCAVGSDHSLTCWGNGSSGQNGADQVDYGTPNPVATPTGIETVAGGVAHTCALTVDHTVLCWGADNFLQLGDGNSTPLASYNPVPRPVVGLAAVTAISVGGYHACALNADTTVSCWGRDDSGQLGYGSAGFSSSTPNAVVGLTGVTAVAAGGAHTSALKADGTVACWGANGYGQLGDGSTTSSASPVAVPGLTDVTAIAAGGLHTCALRADGSVLCWGDGERGQLGDGTNATVPSPQVVSGLSGVASITAGALHTCALGTDHAVRCWGLNADGELGNLTHVDANTPQVVLGL